MVVPAMVLAPWLLPAVFGAKWQGMVVPFEILLPVGVAHAVVNMIGESLSGTGNVGFHARMQALWTVLMIPSLILLVDAWGITGAAVAHLIVVVPVSFGYVVWGARRIGLTPGQVAGSLRGVAGVLALQVIVTLGVLLALRSTGIPAAASAACAAVAGTGVAAWIATRRSKGGLSGFGQLALSVVSGRGPRAEDAAA
jgi:O-antigen/teichoic acid export membrane protein